MDVLSFRAFTPVDQKSHSEEKIFYMIAKARLHLKLRRKVLSKRIVQNQNVTSKQVGKDEFTNQESIFPRP